MSSSSLRETIRGIRKADSSGSAGSRYSLPTILGHIVTVALAASVIVPVGFMLLTTFRPPSSMYADTVYWIPKTFTVDNYAGAWSGISQQLINSLIIATGTTILSLLVSVPGAYALGRLEFPGRRIVFFIVVIALMFPGVLLVGPIGSTWRQLGIFNTFPGLWLAYQAFVSPFALWILRDFFEGLPDNLEEAAQVYGCTEASAIYRVIVPLSIPALVAIAFLAFLRGWNDFLFSNLLTTATHRPAVVELFRHAGGRGAVSWETVLPQTFIIAAPPIILYFLAQRYMTETFAF